MRANLAGPARLPTIFSVGSGHGGLFVEKVHQPLHAGAGLLEQDRMAGQLFSPKEEEGQVRNYDFKLPLTNFILRPWWSRRRRGDGWRRSLDSSACTGSGRSSSATAFISATTPSIFFWRC